MTKTNIGLLGGTFDPIHTGHLIIAEYIREELDLAKIIFIPAKIHPLKAREQMTPAHHRFEMTKLAIADNPFFEISDIEIRSDRISYTVDTVNEFREMYPDDRYRLFFIMGMDNVNQLHMWKDPHRLLSLCQVVAMFRPGFQPVKEAEPFLPKIQVVKIPLLEISSTDIRQRIRSNRSIRYLVPEQVINYIINNKLYRI